MPDVTHYKFEVHQGLPPDGEPGLFFGFDAEWNSYILSWREKSECWSGVGFDPKRPEYPLCFLAREEMAGFIRNYARAPMRITDAGRSALSEDAHG